MPGPPPRDGQDVARLAHRPGAGPYRRHRLLRHEEARARDPRRGDAPGSVVRGPCDAQVNNPVFVVDQRGGLREHDKDDVEEGVRALLRLLDAPRRTKPCRRCVRRARGRVDRNGEPGRRSSGTGPALPARRRVPGVHRGQEDDDRAAPSVDAPRRSPPDERALRRPDRRGRGRRRSRRPPPLPHPDGSVVSSVDELRALSAGPRLEADAPARRGGGRRVRFEPEAVRRVIREYTGEGGVKNLPGQLADICRLVLPRRPAGARGPRSSRRTSRRISRGTSRRPAAPGRPDGHSPRRRRPRVRRVPRRGGAERPGPPRAGRRRAGVHLREGEERRAGEVRARGRRGHLDLNRARCRLEAHRVAAGRPPERAVGVLLHARPRGPAALAGAARVGRAQLLREGRRGRVRVRCGLRPAREAPLDPRRRRAAPGTPRRGVTGSSVRRSSGSPSPT